MARISPAHCVRGAVAGDVIGSVYEFNNADSRDVPLFTEGSRFTDDTVLTMAAAESLMAGRNPAAVLKQRAREWPDRSYGGRFFGWAMSDSMAPYNSFGNGAAMRVSPVAHFARSEAELMRLADRVTAVTHNHPEGLRGARAVAGACWLAARVKSPVGVGEAVQDWFRYDTSVPLARLAETHRFDETCQGTVPAAVRCVMEAEDYESAIRNALWLGGDTDTIGCIAGSIAGALWGVPDWIWKQTWVRLPDLHRDLFSRMESPGLVVSANSDIKTSDSHPIRVDAVDYPGGGRIGMTFCPGKHQIDGQSGHWERDLEADLSEIMGWGATHLVTLMEWHEFEELGAEALPELTEERGMTWWHIPIVDQRPPGRRFETQWPIAGPVLHDALKRGQSVVLHCKGGLGRTGTVACRLLIEAGVEPDDALERVRAARRGTVETDEQERYLFGLRSSVRSCG